MDTRELLTQITEAETPRVVSYEKWENDAEYVGHVHGARVSALSPVALAMKAAAEKAIETQP